MIINVDAAVWGFYVKFAFPTFVLRTNWFGTQFQPSSYFKFGYLGNRGHTAGTVCLCPVPTEAIKAHQLGLQEALNMESFYFQPGSYLFILPPWQQNELLNSSVYRLGQLSPFIPQMPEALGTWWQPRGILLMVSPQKGSQGNIHLQSHGDRGLDCNEAWHHHIKVLTIFEHMDKHTCIQNSAWNLMEELDFQAKYFLSKFIILGMNFLSFEKSK